VVDYVANPDWPVLVRDLTGGRGADRIVDVVELTRFGGHPRNESA